MTFSLKKPVVGFDQPSTSLIIGLRAPGGRNTYGLGWGGGDATRTGRGVDSYGLGGAAQLARAGEEQLRFFRQQDKFGYNRYFLFELKVSMEKPVCDEFKMYTRSTMRQRVSNIAFINIERAHANSVAENDMDRIIDIFGQQNGRDSFYS